MKKGHQISVSDISIFELSAKGAKHVTSGTLTAERVTRGIRAIVYSDAVKTIPIHDSRLLLVAFALRNRLSDFIDCLILSSAMTQCDALITEDEEIQNLKKSREFNELIASTNREFRILTLDEAL
jgi:PIN domain nuclease of toxin-antitoxin system